MQKFRILLVSLMIIAMFSITSCERTEITAMTFFNNDSASVSAMIDAIAEASFETEKSIEEAYAAYFLLEEDVRPQVENFDRLLALREEVADLYARTDRKGTRVDRSKILIGTYCLNFWDEAHVKELADCGIDFIAGAGYGTEYMDLLEKYGVGAFVSVGAFGYPSWRGGDRDMGSEPRIPSFDAEYFATFSENAKAMDRESIWGIELVDEPYTEDFWFYDSIVNKIYEIHEDYQVYINLFPNYANSSQLGSHTYQEHVDEYVKQVNVDYISYDHYMYQHDGGTECEFGLAIENMHIVGNACRDNDKDFWIVVQANSNNPETFTPVEQLRMQANTALAFGSSVINWACWNPGWFYNNIVDSNGVRTEQYEKVKLVNEEIATLSPVYMKYAYKDACILGERVQDCSLFYKNNDNSVDNGVITALQVPERSKNSVLCGYFEKRQGEGSALMIVNVTDEYCETEESTFVKFRVENENATVTAYTTDGCRVLVPDAEGYYRVETVNAEYVFVTVE